MTKTPVLKEGLLGRKLGMGHIFNTEGEMVPVTLIEAGPCFVLQVKQAATDGYDAVQLGFGAKKMQRCNKASVGHSAKAGKGSFSFIKEVRCNAAALGWAEAGKELTIDNVFKDGDFVDVSGISIGRGFTGVVRRYGHKGQPSTRGTHEVRRHTGAIGCRKFPGHVFKNKRMPGQHGAANITVQNLKVVGVNTVENIIMVKGGIPGSKGTLVVIRKASKK